MVQPCDECIHPTSHSNYCTSSHGYPCRHWLTAAVGMVPHTSIVCIYDSVSWGLCSSPWESPRSHACLWHDLLGVVSETIFSLCPSQPSPISHYPIFCGDYLNSILLILRFMFYIFPPNVPLIGAANFQVVK